MVSVSFPNVLKHIGGAGLSLAPRCRFDRCIFLIGHMRCGSTALANILCSRAEISGYGESHVAYGQPSALGTLALNQIRRRGWKAKAPYLFDKILHNDLDCDVPMEFFGSRAIFVTRDPDESIASILKLFRSMRSVEYATRADAASYYSERLARMCELWAAFAPTHRISVRYDELVAEPDAELDRLSSFLRLSPKLQNTYAHNGGTYGPGAGDPINAHRFSGIVSGGVPSAVRQVEASGLPDDMTHARRAYAAFCAIALPIVATG